MNTWLKFVMIKYDYNSVVKLLPKVCEWLEIMENNIISIGRDLTFDEIETAKKIGIKNYDIIRVYETSIIPTPSDTFLLGIGKQLGLITANSNGICFRYGIFINENVIDKKAVLTHEMIHTLQYERYGSIKSFITQYLKEFIEFGYHNSNLEKEACQLSKFL